MSNGIENVARVIHHQDDELLTVPVEDIFPDPNQPRQHFSEEELNELAASIEAQGLAQPITVRRLNNKNQFMIIAGERRWRASKLASLTEIPVVVKNSITEDEISRLQLTENLFRQDLNPIELADEIEKQIKYLDEIFDPHPVETLCHQLGVSRAWLHKKRAVNKLSEPVKQLMRDGITQDINILIKIEKLLEPKKQEFFDLMSVGEITVKDALNVVTRSKQKASSNKNKSSTSSKADSRQSASDVTVGSTSTIQLEEEDVIWLLKQAGWDGDVVNNNNVKDIIYQLKE